MIKIVALLKRRSDLSREEFENYYEQQHALIGAAVFPGRARKYMRRYFRPMQHPSGENSVIDDEFDMVMEMWFDDELAFSEAMSLFSQPPLDTFLVEDEQRLFDREKIRMYFVEERETQLDRLPKQSLTEIKSALGITDQE